jgi:transcription elongation factor/antiterminator RfaH
MCVRNHRWFAVHTQPHHEVRARTNLEFQGFATLLPVRTKTVRHARKFRTVMAPLFPGYLFVSLDLARDPWRAVNGTIGVRSLVMGGDRPATVPSGLVEAFLAMQDEQGCISFAANLEVGQKVKVATGPFVEMVGDLERLDDAGRVNVLLNLLGTQVHVRVKADALVPA